MRYDRNEAIYDICHTCQILQSAARHPEQAIDQDLLLVQPPYAASNQANDRLWTDDDRNQQTLRKTKDGVYHLMKSAYGLRITSCTADELTPSFRRSSPEGKARDR